MTVTELFAILLAAVLPNFIQSILILIWLSLGCFCKKNLIKFYNLISLPYFATCVP